MPRFLKSRTGKDVRCVMDWDSWESGLGTIEEVMNKKPGDPWFPYAVSSVERGMAAASVNEAVLLVEPENAEEILEKFREHMRNTPYTNWSGD